MIDNRTVGRCIARLRVAKGMTQQGLAAALNVSHQASGKRARLCRICRRSIP